MVNGKKVISLVLFIVKYNNEIFQGFFLRIAPERLHVTCLIYIININEGY